MRRREFLGLAGALLLGGGCAALPRPGRGETRAEVLVLGAGFAGLFAARLLREAGVHVLLLEAGQRPGGRVHTLFELGAQEAGAVESAPSYGEFLALCGGFGLETLPVSYPRRLCIGVRGALVAARNWRTAPQYVLAAAERALPPHRLLSRYLPQPLPVSDWRFWGDPGRADLDIPLLTHLRRAGASQEAIRLIAANLNGAIERRSLADLLRSALIRKMAGGGGSLRLRGGNGQLAQRMAGELADALQYGRQVRRIRAQQRGVEVQCMDGARFRADAAICALPFPVLREVELELPLSAAKRAAISGMEGLPATRVFLRAQRAFWQEDGLPPDMWTDTPLGRVFALPAAGGEDGGAAAPEAGAQLGVLALGRAARQLDSALDADPLAPLEMLRRLRPASEGALRMERVVSWGRNPFARGAFSHYPAGGVSRYARAVAAPEGRLFFAGAHTAPRAPGMEAALQSGRRAAGEVLALLGGGEA